MIYCNLSTKNLIKVLERIGPEVLSILTQSIKVKGLSREISYPVGLVLYRKTQSGDNE